MSTFKKVGIFVKPTQDLKTPLERLIEILEKSGAEVFLSHLSLKSFSDHPSREGYSRETLAKMCDLAIVLGGDGTMLGVARDLAPFDCPIVGVNAGRLGFITDFSLESMAEGLPKILSGEFLSDERRLLRASIWRAGQKIHENTAVNDIGVSHGRAGGMIEFSVSVDGLLMSSQLADGVICSTATGSTAYALAAGGPILHPSLEGVILVPVAAHTLSSRPIVLPRDAEVTIDLTDAREAVAYFDMQEFFDVCPGDQLKISYSNEKIKILHPKNYNYFDILRRKLQWNFMPSHPTDSRQ